MSAEVLTAELAAIRAEQRRLYTRAHHVQNALTMTRLGADAGIVRAGLAAKGIIVDTPVAEPTVRDLYRVWDDA